jgi:hypothetical protein
MFQKADGRGPARPLEPYRGFEVDAALGMLASDLSAGGVEAIEATFEHVGAQIPPHILDAACELLEAGERVDMSSLAVALAMGRTSLYRKVGDRQVLLGAGFWRLLQRSLGHALHLTTSVTGVDRLADTVAVYLDDVGGQRWLTVFLAREPECGLRVLLDRDSAPQQGLTRAFYALMEAELQRGHLDATARPDLLAYPVVRICESFLYADIVNGRGPDIEAAVFAVRALLHGQARPLPLPLAGSQPAAEHVSA